jgi:hypothetical protein
LQALFMTASVLTATSTTATRTMTKGLFMVPRAPARHSQWFKASQSVQVQLFSVSRFG